MTDYTFRTRLALDPVEAEQRIREALSEQGFGVLTEIDVQATLKAKLGEDMPPYKILGACNAPLAHQALEADLDIGALLPCNIVVRAHPDGGTELIAADPEAMLSLSDRAEQIAPIAADAKRRVREAFDAVST